MQSTRDALLLHVRECPADEAPRAVIEEDPLPFNRAAEANVMLLVEGGQCDEPELGLEALWQPVCAAEREEERRGVRVSE